MKKAKTIRDFDYYIDEYMYHCRSRKLRPKTMSSYEQTLRLFERWCLEEAEITQPSQVLDTTIRHYTLITYINSLPAYGLTVEETGENYSWLVTNDEGNTIEFMCTDGYCWFTFNKAN